MAQSRPTQRDPVLLDGRSRLATIGPASAEAAEAQGFWAIDPRRILDAVASPFYVTDAAGRLIYYNAAAAACWGRHPPLHESRWAGALALYLEDGTPLPFEETGLARSLRHGVEMPGRKVLIERPDGGRAAYMPYPSLIRDAAGTVVGAVNLLLDVTALEQAHAREKEAAIAKARFLSAVSHEFRTPIHAILGFAELLTDVARTGGPLSAAHEAWIAEVQSAGHHLLDLVNDAIGFTQASIAEAKPATGRRTARLGAIVADVVSVGAAAYARHGLSIIAEGQRQDCLAALDPAAVRQALLSILREVARHSASGATVRITWGPASDSTAHVDVQCPGLTLPPELLGEIDRPFAGTERNSLSRGLEGAGLSIATAAALLRGHAGRLSVSGGQEGAPLVFRLLLPVAPEEEARREEPMPGAAPEAMPMPHPALSLADVVAAANDMIVVTAADLDAPGPTIVYVNAAFLKVTGYSSEEVLGRTPRMLQGPGTSRTTLQRLGEGLRRRQAASAKLLNYAKDGTPYWVDLRIVPLRNARGEVTHFAAIERVVEQEEEAA